MLPAATRPSKRALSTSMCSRPFSSGHDAALDGARIDPLDRVVEAGRLDGHEEEVDGLRELLDDLDARR
jgi:hypothetical protein